MVPWVGAVLDGLLAVLAPLVAVVEDLDLRPRPERDPLRPRPLHRRLLLLLISRAPTKSSDRTRSNAIHRGGDCRSARRRSGVGGGGEDAVIKEVLRDVELRGRVGDRRRLRGERGGEAGGGAGAGGGGAPAVAMGGEEGGHG